MNDYIQLNGKKYKVTWTGYKPEVVAPKSIDYGITGKLLVQNFIVADRTQVIWNYEIRAYVVTPSGQTTWGDWDDIEAAAKETTIVFTDFDGTSYTVTIANPLTPTYNTLANISEDCDNAVFVNLAIVKDEESV